MTKKKTLPLLAIALLGCMLSASATASAAVWTDAGIPLSKNSKFSFFGGEIVEVGLGSGVSCAAEATLLMIPGSTGQVTAFHPFAEECIGFGELGECEVVTAKALNLPWDVDVNASDLTFTGTRVDRTFDPGCPIEELESKVPQLTVGLESPGAITELETSGTGVARIEPGSVEAELTTLGGFQISPPLAGTYGIG